MLRQRLTAEMKEAMKAGDKAKLATVRLIQAALKDKDIEARGLGKEPLGEEEIFSLLQKMIKQRNESAAVYEQGGAWRALADLLPVLRRQLPAGDWQALARRAWGGHLAQVAGEPGYPSRKARLDALQQAWKAVPAEFRADEDVAGTYAALLAKHESVAEAQATLEKALNDGDWSEALVAQYGRLDAENPATQLAALEKWLLLRPTNAALLLAAGRASLRNKLWGKARDYFEASVNRQATAETCAELVRLYTRLGETAKADQYLRRQVELGSAGLPKLPLPSARV